MLTSLIASSTVALCGGLRRRLERPERKERSFLGGHIRLTSLYNRGAAFGLPIGKKALLGVSAAAMAGAFFHRKSAPVSIGLMLGGGLSNLAERLTRGTVYDYLHFPQAPGKLKHYVYNAADFAIFSGALLLILPRRKRRR